MSRTFNYNGEVLWSDEITLESLGNVCLDAVDSVERHYFLIARTLLGETTYLEFGPLYLEKELLPDKHDIHFERFEFSENALAKKITKFLGPKQFIGNKKVKIIDVKEITVDEALSYGINPFKYLMDYSDTSNY